MKCPICDAQLADTAKFCGVCGSPVTPAAPSAPVQPVQAQPEPQWNVPQQPAQQWNNPVQPQQNQYYGGMNNQSYAPAQNMYYSNQPGYNPQPFNQPQRGMGWFKFLIYFALFAGALVNLSQGFMFLTGSIYEVMDGVDTDFVYFIFRDLETADKLYGILLIVIAVVDIVARFQLAGFKKSGPMMVNLAYILPIVASIIYIIMVIGAVDDLTDATLSSISSIFVSFIFMVSNAVYFKKRKYMFVN